MHCNDKILESTQFSEVKRTERLLIGECISPARNTDISALHKICWPNDRDTPGCTDTDGDNNHGLCRQLSGSTPAV